jgi:hypothetical protein
VLGLAAAPASAQFYDSYGYGGQATGPYNGAYGYPQYGYGYQTGFGYGSGGYPFPSRGYGYIDGGVPSWWWQRDIGGYRGCDPYWQRGECFDNYYGAYGFNVLTGGWPGSGADYRFGYGGYGGYGCCGGYGGYGYGRFGGGWGGGFGPAFQPGHGYWNPDW